MEIPDSLNPDFRNLFQVYGISSCLSWLKRNWKECNLFSVVYKISGKHDIWNIIILRELPNISVNQLRFHQPERCIGIRNLYPENNPEKEADRIFHKLAGLSVSSLTAIS